MSEIEWSPWIKRDFESRDCPIEAAALRCAARMTDGDEYGAHGLSVGDDWSWFGVTHYRIPMEDYRRITGMPEWSEAPEWARFLCQDPGGQWKFTDTEPRHEHEHGCSFWLGEIHKETGLPGTVLGDWRDTLQERPADRLDTHPNSDIDADECSVVADTVDTSDGSTARYYQLPEGATELQHLISYRNMNAQDGEIFRAVYRKGRASHSDALRDARKVLFYAKAEVARLEKYGE